MSSCSTCSMIIIVDNFDPLVQYNPPANWIHGGSSIEYNKTTASSKTQGDTATFSFEGTTIAVYGTVGPNNGSESTMSFSIDSDASTTFDYTAPKTTSALYHQLFIGTSNLSEGSHTLWVTQKSTSPDGIIFLDYFLYNGTATAGKTIFIDDVDVIEYSPSGWSSGSSLHTLKHTLHTCKAPGCRFSFSFEGTSASVHGPIANLGSGGFNASVTIDGGAPVLIYHEPPATTTYNNQLFGTSDLSPGNHTMVLTTLTEQRFYVDYFLVEGAANAAAASVSNLPPPIPTLPSPSPVATSISRAAVIGCTVGGVVALVCLLVCVWMWRRRRRVADGPEIHPFNLLVASSNVESEPAPPSYEKLIGTI
ncbi:hypothetical protein C8R43DRAFT_1108083 [Mycena crocata]|nr:hypothetical protein C8R43DRAFT_1108083 [Mycena crocata]